MILTLLFSGCASGLSSVDPAIFEAEPSYTHDIAPFLDRWCVDCHESGGVMYDGVELDTFAAAQSTGVKSACTTLTPELVEVFSDSLLPADGHTEHAACAPWTIASMPPGAMERPGLEEQIRLARWIELGSPQ